MSAAAEPARHGLLGVFDTPEALIAAGAGMRQRGYRQLDALTPFPVEGLDAALQLPQTRLPWIMLAGGIFGAVAIFALQSYSVLVAYPINVGGRPLFSWPAFLIPTFECAVLGAAISGFVAMLALNGLPRLYHPVFNAPDFSFARGDLFYLLVEGHDPKFQLEEVRRQLTELGARTVEEVAP